MKKYEFTGETKDFGGRTLKRIRRLSDGLVGGWIESEENLSHEGSCFVYDSAWVYDSALVYDSAQVFDSARVYGSALVYGSAWVCGDEQVSSPVVAISGCRYRITVLDSTVIWGCRIFDWESLNEFQFSDCTTRWDRHEFEDEKALVIAACRRKWGI